MMHGQNHITFIIYSLCHSMWP